MNIFKLHHHGHSHQHSYGHRLSVDQLPGSTLPSISPLSDPITPDTNGHTLATSVHTNEIHVRISNAMDSSNPNSNFDDPELPNTMISDCTMNISDESHVLDLKHVQSEPSPHPVSVNDTELPPIPSTRIRGGSTVNVS